MVNFLTNYLVTPPFDNTKSSSDIAFQAQNGYYSLQDYAVQHWYHHAQALADVVESSKRHEIKHLEMYSREAIASLQKFIHYYSNFQISKRQISESVESQQSLSASLAQVPQDEHERTSYLNLERRTTWIRNEIERLEVLNSSQKDVLDDLYGPTNLFKCQKPWCPRFTDGFRTLEERTSHMNRHDRPFQCRHEDCLWFSFGFETEADLQAHYDSHHSEAREDIEFPKSVGNPVSKLPGLLQAAKDGDFNSVKTYLDDGQDINLRNRYKSPKTPLWYAAENGHYEICELLISRGADTGKPIGTADYRTSGIVGQTVAPTAIAAAARRGNTRILKLLLRHETTSTALTEKDLGIALNFAIQNYHLDSVLALAIAYQPTFDIGPHFMDVLKSACRSGDDSIIKILLQHGFLQSSVTLTDEFLSVVIFNNEQSIQPMVEILLSTGMPVITSQWTVGRFITGTTSLPSVAMLLLSYPKTTLDTRALKSLQKTALEKSHLEIVDFIETILVSRGE